MPACNTTSFGRWKMLDESLKKARARPAKANCSREIPNSPSRTNPYQAETLRQPRHTVLGNRDLRRDKKLLLIPLLICRAFPSPEEEQRDTEFWSLAQSILGLKASQHTAFFLLLLPVWLIWVPLPRLQTQYTKTKVPMSYAHKSYRVQSTPPHNLHCENKSFIK